MTVFDRLLAETAPARVEFLAIPMLQRALAGDVPRPLYIEFLTQAYHHVRHTCPLLSLAAERTTDAGYAATLRTYIEEERGHEQWILDDIAAMGGDRVAAARCSRVRRPCRAMVGYAHYAIDRISPYSLLGMVHVLEGASVQLATRAADALERTFGWGSGKGFVYLRSHGAADAEHTAFFEAVINRLITPAIEPIIIDSARMMYWLYGNIFRDLERDLDSRI